MIAPPQVSLDTLDCPVTNPHCVLHINWSYEPGKRVASQHLVTHQSLQITDDLMGPLQLSKHMIFSTFHGKFPYRLMNMECQIIENIVTYLLSLNLAIKPVV